MEALRAQKRRQAEERVRAGDLWQEHGLALTTSVGTPFESHNLRREFRKVTAAAGLGTRWVPKELRTSFVSMMSYHVVPVEEIARLRSGAWTADLPLFRGPIAPFATTSRGIRRPAADRRVRMRPGPRLPCRHSWLTYSGARPRLNARVPFSFCFDALSGAQSNIDSGQFGGEQQRRWTTVVATRPKHAAMLLWG